MDEETMQSVVKSVNFMSRQLLSDCHAATKRSVDHPLSQYYTAMCAVTKPSVDRGTNKSISEYQ